MIRMTFEAEDEADARLFLEFGFGLKLPAESRWTGKLDGMLNSHDNEEGAMVEVTLTEASS